MMSEDNRLDVIVFGATGYTGNYAARQMAKFAKNRPQTTWGIAGRNKAKLEKVLEEVAEKTGENLKDVELVVADTSDAESIEAMARRAKVVVNCVGPYAFFGEVVVNACVEAGTHHVDVSGETLYMETMIKKYDEKARENKAYIISACGFDSIPADMGVVYAQKHFQGQINSIEAYLSRKIVGPRRPGPQSNIGTWDSLVNEIGTQKQLKPLRKEIFKEELPEMEPTLKSRGTIHHNTLIGTEWCLPFPGSDKDVVVRSQRHFYFHDKKRPIQFNVYFTVGSLFSTVLFAMFASIIATTAKFSCGRKLLRKYPKFFSLGFFDRNAVPDEEGNKAKHFSFHLIAEGWKETLPEPTDQFSVPPNKRVIFKVSGVDPGYYTASTAAVLSALTILDEKDNMPDNGGVITAGAAFANTTLLEKLHENGITFEIVSQTDL